MSIFTFLFTDIAGSTNLAREYPDMLPDILARHQAIFQAVIAAHHGVIFQLVGDEIDAAFESTLDALLAALAVQHALNDEVWPVAPIVVRMGLHSGPAVLRNGKYEGYLTLSHAKRLMSIAHGGQILLSEAAEILLRDSLPEEITLLNLGEQRLKDFPRAEPVYQVVAPGLPADFPPLKSLSSAPNNLPVQLTSFIGRARELDEVKQLLAHDRLLTLTGPGGSGKTRLALQAASEIVENFRDGVFFVGLAPITDAGLVASTISQSLGIREMPGRSIVDSLKDYLQNKNLLLVLDNFEQVITAAPLVAELLVGCTNVKILVTSREGLRISGEREYSVQPLALPDPTQLPSLETVSQYAAVQLFVQRAKAVKPDFRITNDTATVVVEICHRLDGLPLAIELAAARIKLLPPRAMLDRLDSRLEFLTGGGRDLPARQQTLRGAVAWSYDLLSQSEQRLFRRLAVFVGSCSLDAVEAVAGDGPAAAEEQPPDGLVLDQLGSLLDKSLLQEGEGLNNEPRFFMLETLREFGLEQLAASGEQAAVRRRHAEFFLALAEQGGERLESASQVQWMNQMEQEHDNLRAALDWSMAAEGAGEICMRLAGMLGLFWEARGYYSEGRERMAVILKTDSAQGQTTGRARLLARAAELAYRQSDYPATKAYALESLSIYREVGDEQGTASALIKLGNAATEVGDYAAAARYLEEALATWRKLADKQGTARALISLGWVGLRAGKYSLAKRRLTEAYSLSRELGDTRSMGFELAGLGEAALRQGDYKRAVELVEESLALRRQLGNKWGIGVSLGILGWIAMREENWPLAVQKLGESLVLRREIGDQSGSAWCLERLAAVVQAQGQLRKAASLFGASAALRASIRSVIDPVDQPAYESKLKSLRAKLGREQFAAAWDEGRAMTLDQAIAYALEQ